MSQMTPMLSEILNKHYVMALVGSEIVGFIEPEGTNQHITITFGVDGEDHRQEFVDQQIHLLDHPKGGFFVTDIEGKDCGFIALDGVDLAPARTQVLIHLDGGLVQAVLANRPDIEAIIIDYDTEGADDDELTDIPQDDGTTSEAIARIETATFDSAFIEQTSKALEAT